MSNIRPKILVTLIILLIAANCILFVASKKKQTRLKQAQFLITDDTALIEHIQHGVRSFKGLLNDIEYYEPQGVDALLTAMDLIDKIDTLLKIARASSGADPQDFFSATIEVDKSLRDSLFSCYQRFEVAAHAWYPDTLSTSFYPILQRARHNYRQMVETVNDAPRDGTMKLVWNIEMEDTVVVRNVDVVKRENKATWDEIGAKIPRHIRNLDYFIFRQPLDVHENLLKLKKAIGVRDKVTMDGRTYDLTHISPAQLLIVAKHLQLLQMNVNESMLFHVNLYRDED